MELNICHLYPDLLNVYGDFGNILVLKHRAEKRNIKVNIIETSINDKFDKDLYDITFFGGGQDYEQSIVSSDIFNTKQEDIRDYIENGKVLLAICGGYQLLGKYYITSNGEKLDGLDILNIYTEACDDRFIGNTAIYNEEYDETYVGFENHSGRTYINDLKPLGKVLYGYGNNGKDGFEGCVYKNTYGTYFHGSLLSKNPELADRMIETALSKKYGSVKLEPIDDTLEIKAKESILEKLKSGEMK